MFAAGRPFGSARRLALGLTALAVTLYVVAAANFWHSYPSSYVWTELFISYEGGFVRRGLLGQIAFLLHPLVSAQVLLAALFLVVYIGIAARVVYLACAHLNFGSLLFLVSPVALAFPLNDPAAFARKDAITFGTFLLALYVIERLAARPMAALGAVVILYVGAGLVHELAWLYFPLAVAFLLNTSGRDLAHSTVVRVAAASVLLILAAAIVSIVFKGNDGLESRMVAAWQVREPGAFVPLNAANYISESYLTNILVMVTQTFDALVIAGYVTAAFLGGVAVVAYALDRPPAISTDPLRARLTRYGAYAMLLVFAIAADWGRVIHLFWMHAFVFLASLPPASDRRPVPLIHAKHDPKLLLYGLAFLFLYAATWRLAHSGLRTNALLPGYIFDLQPLYRQIFGLEPVSGIPIDG